MEWLRAVVGLLMLVVSGPADANSNAAAAMSSRAYLASIEPSPGLQAFLNQTVSRLLARDASARSAELSIALIELDPAAAPPQMAHWQGERPVYPASVVKFVYLMAAFAWQEQGRLTIDPGLDRDLRAMIERSSNKATQRVVARLADTEPGPALPRERYRQFRHRRLAVKRWLERLGITGIHSIHPTYDGGGDLFGRDIQLLEDNSVPGGLNSPDGRFHNRQAMTAVATARLLALLATDRALTPEDSAEVRGRMRRDPARQPYLMHRIAGGAIGAAPVDVYSKTGTWGPIFADAGIIRDRSGRQAVLAVFIDSSPAYRGGLIAALARRVTEHLLAAPGMHSAGERPDP